MRRLARTLALVAAVAAAAASTAALAVAGPPGSWTRVTDPNGKNIDQVALARTADGALHVLWLRQSESTSEDLVHSAISPGGTLAGSTANVVAGWGALANAGLVVTHSGLQAFLAGVRSSDTTDPYSGGTVYTVTAGADGATWTLAPGAVAAPSSAYATNVLGVTLAKDGSPVTAWAGTFGTVVHIGSDPALANTVVQSACCGYETGLATDSKTGEVVLAWFSNATGGEGIHTRTVSPSLGPDKYLPGSGDAARANAVSPDQQVAATGRIGAPGVYVAYGIGYPTWRALSVWRHDTGTTLRVWKGTVRHFSIAAGPEGRLWVMWTDGQSLLATRSNRAATRFGPIVTAKPPAGTDSIWKVQGEGSRGPLDLLVSVSTPGSLAFWHTQVQPKLALVARRGPAQGRAVFAVVDAGDPVKGATVKVGGRSLVTDASGRAATTLAPGSYKATASAPGFVGATGGILVPKPKPRK